MKPEKPTLEPNGVHLWLIDLTKPQPVVLSADEQERADRFKVQPPRKQFVTTRSALRLLLAYYLDSQPLDIEFEYADHGKPNIRHPDTTLQFNVSHAKECALIAIADSFPIGVDIEWLERKTDTNALSKRFYSVAEQQQLGKLPADQRHRAFLNLWTQKEAFLKAQGSGLSRDTRTFSVSTAGGLLADERQPAAAEKWTIRTLIPAPGYCAAVAAPAADIVIRQFTHTIDLHPPG